MIIFLINITEWFLISIIGLCGTVAFVSSGTYASISNYFVSHYPEIGRYLMALIWIFIAAVGVFSVSFRRKGGGRFTWLALIFALPSILSFNKLNVPALLGFDNVLTTKLEFWQTLVLAAGILTAYLSLNFMRELKITRLSLNKKRADKPDIDNWLINSHIILLLALLCTLVLSAVIALFAIRMEAWLLPYFHRLPWNIIMIGVGCLLVLAFYVYWLGTHHKSSNK